ncbi:ParB N-terminal domain-containing protein [Staphylospora marina]|uniref:ParB N-terminal domain-containing protein n=1 Tax=Staphylospora marina TaxID=2490858 RepID=UPI0013DDD7D9|nr:ParB N-terminal domain-containing protein [Staphylospora marina]
MNLSESLKRIRTEELRLHEAHEPCRLEKTAADIRRDGMLRHPVLALDIGGGWMVVDGAHRLESLKKLGCAFAPVQVLTFEALTLSSWIHQVPDGDWLDEWVRASGLRVLTGDETPAGDGRWSVTWMRRGQRFTIRLDQDVEHDDRIPLERWHQLVSAYSRRFPVCRLTQFPANPVESEFVWIRHPVRTPEDLVETVNRGDVLPAGVTRFRVEGRILNLCVPLALLEDDPRVAAEWEMALRHWSQHVRAYHESVLLCEG